MGLFDIFKKKTKEEQSYAKDTYDTKLDMGEPTVTQTTTSVQQVKEDQNMAGYDPNLARIVASLSAEEKEQILTYIRNDTKVFAIKLCRELTGIGLKEAKDLVDDYEKYFTKE